MLETRNRFYRIPFVICAGTIKRSETIRRFLRDNRVGLKKIMINGRKKEKVNHQNSGSSLNQIMLNRDKFPVVLVLL